MTLTLSSYTFESPIHGTMQVPVWDIPVSQHRWFGVSGEYETIGQASHRILTCDATLSGFATHLLIQEAIGRLNTKVREGLNGTLNVDLGGGDSVGFTTCRFLGWFPGSDEPRLDGSGANGFYQRGVLKWRQKA